MGKKVKRLSKGHINYDAFGCKSHLRLDPCSDVVSDVNCNAPQVALGYMHKAQEYVQQRLDRIIARHKTEQ